MTDIIRMASDADADEVSAIYAPVVRETPISFELEPPAAQEIRQRIVDTVSTLPWLVFERDRRVLGYAYANQHRSRWAYQWSVDASVYVDSRTHRRGVGRKLYTALFRILEAQGFYTVLAGITLPNPPSVGLHEALGFKLVGIYRNVGYKTGAWRDVGWWALTLREYNEAPKAPRPVTALKSSEIDQFLSISDV